MTKWFKTVGFTALSILALGACGDDGDGGGTNKPNADATPSADSSVNPTADAMPTLMGIDAVCAPDGPFADLFAKVVDCSPAFFRFKAAGTDLFGGEAMAKFCRDNLVKELGTGTVVIEDGNIQACRDYVANTPCEEIDINNIETTPCGKVSVGSVAEGDVCDVSAQCAGDSICQATQDDCGACSPRLAAGTACSNDEQCIDGKCNSAKLCATPVKTGGLCAGQEDCAGILQCDQATNTCLFPRVQVGDTCGRDDDCDGGFINHMYCKPGAGDADPKTCAALPQPGEACVKTDVLRGEFVCDILNYVWCDKISNTCMAPTVSQAGAPCHVFPTVGFGSRKCQSGLACTNAFGGFDEEPVGTCVVPGYEGDACSPPTELDSEKICHPVYNCEEGKCTTDSDISGMCPVPM